MIRSHEQISSRRNRAGSQTSALQRILKYFHCGSSRSGRFSVRERRRLGGGSYAAEILEDRALLAATVPFAESFDVADVADLTDWTFQQSGTATVLTSTQSPNSGTHALKYDQMFGSRSAAGDAILQLDLTSVNGVTDLVLELQLQRLITENVDNNFQLAVSADGETDWVDVGPMLFGDRNVWRTYVYDLDAALAAESIAFDSGVFVRFRHNGTSTSHEMLMDDVKVFQGDAFGSAIVSMTPSGNVAGPVTSFNVTFSEPIVAATFTSDDIFVTHPTQENVALAGDPVDSGDQTTFTVSFASAVDIPGNYAVSIGPDILDPAGNSMNQDADPAIGEENGDDAFAGQFTIPGTVFSLPYFEDFEGETLSSLGLSFESSAVGAIALDSENAPFSGSQQLHFDQTSSVYSEEDVFVTLDLLAHASADNIALDFRAKRLGSSSFTNSLNVSIRDNEGLWNQISAKLTPDLGDWVHYAFDIDAAATANSVSLASPVVLRIRHIGNSTSHEAVIDDLRVDLRDSFGPMVQSLSPTTPAAAPLSSVEVAFNEAIDVASFTAADVTIRDPAGRIVPLLQDPVDTGNQTTFTLSFSPQVLKGEYSVRLSQDISDPTGNLMNQDGDDANAELNGDDSFIGSVVIGPPVTHTVPYLEPFDAAALEGLSLSLATVELGGVTLQADSDVFSGSQYLRLAPSGPSSVSSQEHIVVKLDLTAVADATDLVFDFDGKQIGSNSSSNSTGVYLSVDGEDWKFLNSARNNGSDSVNFAFDLDAEMAARGIAADAGVFLGIRHFGKETYHVMAVDNLRVARRDGFGPAVIGLAPATPINSPLTTINVTFNEPIDASTFTQADIEIVSAYGEILPLASAPADSGDQTTFTLTLAEPQTVNGEYVVRIGADVFDQSGNKMNQDGDHTNGEGDTKQDRFEGVVTIGPPVAETIAYRQSFEISALDQLAEWTFTVTGVSNEDGDGSIELSPQVLPDAVSQAGEQVLLFDQRTDTRTIQTAVLAVDLSTYASSTDLFFDFHAQARKSSSGNNSLDLAISNDGKTWRTVQSGLGGAVDEWVHHSLDLDTVLADEGITPDANVFFRFRHFGSRHFDEFALDDVRIGRSLLSVDISVDDLTEGDSGTHVVTVSRHAAADTSDALDVMLTTLPAGEINIPTTVTIPANVSSTTFTFTVIDDMTIDGPQRTEIQAAALDFMVGTDTVTIIDNEPATLVLSVDQSTINESVGQNAAVGTIERNQDFDVALVVNLVSGDETEATVPATVTIPAGARFATFEIGTNNDFLVDATQVATITGSATGYVSGTVDIQVENDDTPTDRTIGGNFFGVLPADDYRATFDVNVPTSTTLTIEAGTSIGFDTDVGLNVLGTLSAVGTTDNPITLTSSAIVPASGDWDGLVISAFRETRSELEFLDISFAEHGLEIDEENARVTLSRSKVHDNSVYGIYVNMGHGESVSSTEVVIQGNEVFRNENHGIVVSAAKSGSRTGGSGNGASIIGNNVHDNSRFGILVSASASGGPITFGGAATNTATLRGNHVHNNAAGGISGSASHSSDAFGGAAIGGRWQNNLIESNGGPGIRLTASDAASAPAIYNNTIVNNAGIGFSHETDVESSDDKLRFFNNVVAFNAGGVSADGPFVPDPAMLGYNDVFNNSGANWNNYPASYGSLTTTNGNGDPSDAFFNMSIDPLFVSVTDFHLQPDSKLINAGVGNDAAVPVDDVDGEVRSSIPDIGFDEVQTPDDEPDLVATTFNAVGDHVLGGQTDVTFTVENTGNTAAAAFETHVVWSANDILGDADDMVVTGSEATITGLTAGADETKTISLQLDRAALYANAMASDAAGQPVGTVSVDASRLFLVIDVHNTVIESDEANNSGWGHLIDSDDITYFPWDTNGDGTVTPVEALQAIQAINTAEAAHDFDGNGIVTPLEALSVLQRIGYRRNDDVVSDAPVAATTAASAGAVPIGQSSTESGGVRWEPALPDVENDGLPTFDSPTDDQDEDPLFATESNDVPVAILPTTDDALEIESQAFTAVEWLDLF